MTISFHKKCFRQGAQMLTSQSANSSGFCGGVLRLAAFTGLLGWGALAHGQSKLYTWQGDAFQDYLGHSVSGAGDVNGDGVPDQIVGLIGDDDGGNYSGSVRLFSGADGSQIVQLDGDHPQMRYGRSVAGLGDLDGDGHSEFVVGASNADGSATGTAIDNRGLVRIFDGASLQPTIEVYGSAEHDQLGYDLQPAGDWNGDNVQDVVAGARQFFNQNPLVGTGYALVLSGSDGAVLATFNGTSLNEQFGFSVDSGADVNNDGFPDVIIGAPYRDGQGVDSGASEVYSGIDGQLLYSVEGTAGELSGFSVELPGDLNGDSHADFLIGAQKGFDPNQGLVTGSVKAYSGADGSLLFALYGFAEDDDFGKAIATLGDANGDGRPDFIVGAERFDGNGAGSGGAFVFDSDGVLLIAVNGEEPGDLLGFSVGAAGDVNGDGLDDFVTGGWNHNSELADQVGSSDLFLSQVPLPESYCTAKVNSLGCAPVATATGVGSLGVGNNLVFRGDGMLNGKAGIAFWGYSPTNLPFLGGTLCVLPPLTRTPLQLSGGSPPPANDCSGQMLFAFEQIYMQQQSVPVGSTVHLQFWSRDPGFAAPNNVGLTNGAAAPIVP